MTTATHSLGKAHTAKQDPRWVRFLLISLTFGLIGFMLVLPLSVVFIEAFRDGVAAYFASLRDPDSWSAIKLTFIAAVISVPLNIVFGLAASWAIAKFDFFGKSVLIAIVDLPFAISPVISGLIYVLVFGAQGWFGSYLDAWDIQIIFAVPGIVLATIFDTFPFVARELIPLMQEQGSEEEQAAISLGASGLQTFWRVTLPNIRWGLLYGVILCNARAMGEFGAVSVVSGAVRGGTNTVPLHIEQLYNDHQSAAAFTMASLLALLGVVTLIAKTIVEWRIQQQLHNTFASDDNILALPTAGHLPQSQLEPTTAEV